MVITSVAVAGLVFSLVGCSSNENIKPKESELSQVSLAEDRAYIEDLRHKIPEDKRQENDELALFLNILNPKSGVEISPLEARQRFSSVMRRKREAHNKALQSERKTYTQKERDAREKFMEKLKDDRDSFYSTSKDPKERRRFTEKQSQSREKFFAENRENRQAFEEGVRVKQKDFDFLVKTKTEEFNQLHKEYSEQYKLKKNTKTSEELPSTKLESKGATGDR